jgi:tRNA pseudouridine55 synthase
MNRQDTQDIDGVMLLDKPAGWGSTDALNRVKRLLGARKAGHGGTLDPMATGLLPLAFGLATRFSHESLEADKHYRATLLLGIVTDTADAEGRELQRRPVSASETELRAACAAHVGCLTQVPPMFSALKRDGRPLYEYAREGIELERAPRAVRIDAIELHGLEAVPGVAAGEPGSLRAEITVRCGKGTYIRTLAQDIGERLGCGAHLVALRRERVGGLGLQGAVSLDRLESLTLPERRALLQPADMLVSGLPPVVLDEPHARRFLHGQRLRLAAVTRTEPLDPDGVAVADGGQRVRVYHGARLIGTGQYDDGLLAPRRLLPLRINPTSLS